MRKMLQGVMQMEVDPGDFPIELRLYTPGSAMDWYTWNPKTIWPFTFNR